MEIKKVVGNNIPIEFENLQGGVLINVLPTKNDDDTYTYYQALVYETDSEKLIKLRDKMLIALYLEYINSTGWIWEKYNRNVVVLKNMTEEEFRLKYADIIAEQERNRLLINELELQLGGN